jgi:hypothetical protein
MIKGVTKNREGEKTKVTGISCDGKAVADPTFVNGRQPWHQFLTTGSLKVVVLMVTMVMARFM